MLKNSELVDCHLLSSYEKLKQFYHVLENAIAELNLEHKRCKPLSISMSRSISKNEQAFDIHIYTSKGGLLFYYKCYKVQEEQ